MKIQKEISDAIADGKDLPHDRTNWISRQVGNYKSNAAKTQQKEQEENTIRQILLPPA